MNLIIFDVETTNHSKGSPFDPRNTMVSIVANHITDTVSRILYYHVYSNDVSNCTIDDIRNLFEKNRNALIIGHNLKFDIHWLDRVGIEHGENYYDTMFYEYIALEGQHGKIGLGAVSGMKQDLGSLLVHTHKCNPADIPPSMLIRYNIMDVKATLHVYKRQQRYIKVIREKIKRKLLPQNFYVAPLKLMNDLLPVIIECERNGFCLDKERLEAVREESTETRRILVRNIRKILRRLHGIKFFNLSSSVQLSSLVYSLEIRKEKKDEWAQFFTKFNPFRHGSNTRFDTAVNICFAKLDYGLCIPPVPNAISKTRLSVDRDTLKELIQKNKDHKQIRVLKLIYEISRLDTLISTFIDGTLKKAFDYNNKSWLHTSYNQIITRTARLSSSNPNLQNWPRESTFPVRQCVVSRFENGKIASCDASQIELRYGMWYYGDKQGFIDYTNGIDIHDNVAKIAYGNKFTSVQRTNTKSTVFRVWYRGTARGIVKDQRIPLWDLDEAQTIVDAIYGTYTGVRDGQERDFESVQALGYLDAPSGRRYRFDLSSYKRKFQIANYPIQGGATGDFISCCMIVAHRLFIEKELNSLLIGQVHDEILVDCYPGEEARVEEILTYSLEEGGRLEFETRFNLIFDFPLGSGFKIKEHW